MMEGGREDGGGEWEGIVEAEGGGEKVRRWRI